MSYILLLLILKGIVTIMGLTVHMFHTSGARCNHIHKSMHAAAENEKKIYPHTHTAESIEKSMDSIESIEKWTQFFFNNPNIRS